MTAHRLDPDKVYLVESTEDETVLLALEPEYDDGFMRWFDTVRPRMIPGRLVKQGPTSAELKSEEGATYRFAPLTLKVYEERVRPVVEGSPAFSSEAELHRFYRERF